VTKFTLKELVNFIIFYLAFFATLLLAFDWQDLNLKIFLFFITILN